MPALFSRLKTWASLETLSKTDLNAEFDNIITNMVPLQFDDFSSTVAEMQTQTDPGEQGTESQATTLAGELARIRYQLKTITGKTYWYEAPDSTLASVVSPSLMEAYIGFKGNDTESLYTEIIRRGAILNAHTYNVEGLSESDIVTTNTNLGTGSLDLSAAPIFGLNNERASQGSGHLSLHAKGLSFSTGVAYNPSAGVELEISASGKFVATITNQDASGDSAKNTDVVTSTTSAGASYQNVQLAYHTGGRNGSSNDLLRLYVDGTEEGTAVTGSILQNESRTSTWFINGKRNDPAWDHFYAANGLPAAHTSAWTKTDFTGGGGANGTEDATDGILTIDATGLDEGVRYTRSDNVDLSTGMTVEWKMRHTNMTHNGGGAASSFRVDVGDLSETASYSVHYTQEGITITTGDAAGLTSDSNFHLPFNVFDWHTVRLGITTTALSVWINGVSVLSAETVVNSDGVIAADIVAFGFYDGFNTGSLNGGVAEIEYFAYYDAGVEAPVTIETQTGYMDDIVLMSQPITNSVTLTTLASNKASVALGVDREYNLSPNAYSRRDIVDTASPSSTVTNSPEGEELGHKLYVISDGITPLHIEANINCNLDNNGSYEFWMWADESTNNSSYGGNYIDTDDMLSAGIGNILQVNPGNANEGQFVHYSWTKRFRPGLRTLSPVWSNNGTGSLTAVFKHWWYDYDYRKKG